LVYVNEAGETFMGISAAAAISADCVFGTASSSPVLPGCWDEAIDLLECGADCPPAVTDALSVCVSDCVATATEQAAPPGLSDECTVCSGESAVCLGQNCDDQCLDLTSSSCTTCLCDNGCAPAFEACSGISSGVTCP
jgi:hypothetical protein